MVLKNQLLLYFFLVLLHLKNTTVTPPRFQYFIIITHFTSSNVFNAMLKAELAKSPRNVHSFLEHKKQWKHLTIRNVISVRIFIGFYMLKANVCYIAFQRGLTKLGFTVSLHSESPVFAWYERNTNKSLK